MRSFRIDQRVAKSFAAIAAAGAFVLASLVFMPGNEAPARAVTTVQGPSVSDAEKKVAAAKEAAMSRFTAKPAKKVRPLSAHSLIAQPSTGATPTSDYQVASNGVVGNARISGRVTTPTGVAVPGAMIIAAGSNGEYWSFTNSTGNYTITGLAAGTYSVYFDSSVTTTVKNLTANENRQLPLVKLALKAQIKGTVTGASGNIADVFVAVYSTTNAYSPVGWTYTDADGKYFIHGLPAGNYKVNYETGTVTSGSYLAEWYSDKETHAAADTVQLVTATAVRDALNVSLAQAAEIRGVVKDTQGVNPVGRVPVRVYSIADLESPIMETSSAPSTGAFSFRGLAAGTYRIQFDGGSEAVVGNYRNTWIGGVDLGADSNDVTVGATELISNISVNLLGGTQISGRVSAPGVAGLAGVGVVAVNADDEYDRVAAAYTDSSGNYTIRGLKPHRFHIHVDPFELTTGSYLDQWSGGKSSFATADDVDTSTGNVTGQNFTLVKAATISGVVKSPSGAGIAGVGVSIVKASDEYSYVGYAYTAANGSYTVRGLPAGSYKISFDTDSVSSGSYFPAWFSGKTSWSTATPIVLTATQVKSGVVSTLAKAASISGKVTGLNNQGLSGVDVTAVYSSGERRGGQTDEQGNYTLRGLAAGSYKLYFSGTYVQSGSYLSSWYNNRQSQETATAIVLTSAQVKTGLVTSLPVGGTLTGKVTNSANVGLRNINVSAINDSGDELANANTDGLGNYTIRGIATGASYTLYFRADRVDRGSYFNAWFGAQATSLETADHISLTSADPYSVGTQVLRTAGTVQGRVVSAQGLPVRGADIELFATTDEFNSSATAQTDNVGNFTLRGVEVGSYKVFIATDGVNGGGYLSEWAGTQPGSTFDTANVVNVADMTPVVVGDLIATKESKITGNLISASGDPVAGAYVRVYSASDETSMMAFAQTDSNGVFSAERLRAGTYKVSFDPSVVTSGSYRLTWNDGKTSFAAASVITLALGQIVNLEDAELITGATISGKVTAASGGKPISDVVVRAVDTRTLNEVSNGALTDAAGNYTLRGLPAGSYYVQFDGNSETLTGSYLPGWFPNKITPDGATPIKVASIQNKTGVNYALVKAGTVTGQVVDSSNNPVEDVTVTGYVPTGNGGWAGIYASTDAQGNYVLKGVASTGVKIMFDGTTLAGRALGQIWNNNKTSWQAADVVTVAAGATRANVNATLVNVTWTSISGTIPVGGVGASLVLYDSDGFVATSVTADSSGHFAFTNLTPGTYKIKAYPTDSCYNTNWYSTTVSFPAGFDNAEAITVTGRETTTLANLGLRPILTDVCA